MTDTIDRIVGIRPGDALDVLRRRRPITRVQLQSSHDALFEPVDETGFPLVERLLVAAFATRITADDETAALYAERARSADPERAALVLAEAEDAVATGPFGVYLEEGLVAESTEGTRYEPAPIGALGERLTAALVHAHLLVARPREAHDDEIAALARAGWSADAIVTLSQLVAFLAFQQRVAHGLTLLQTSTPKESAA